MEEEPVTIVPGGLDLASADEPQPDGELKIADDEFKLEEGGLDLAGVEEPVTVVEGGLDLALADEPQPGGELIEGDEFKLDIGDFKLEDQSGLDVKIEETPFAEDLGAKKKPASPDKDEIKLEMDG